MSWCIRSNPIPVCSSPCRCRSGLCFSESKLIVSVPQSLLRNARADPRHCFANRVNSTPIHCRTNPFRVKSKLCKSDALPRFTFPFRFRSLPNESVRFRINARLIDSLCLAHLVLSRSDPLDLLATPPRPINASPFPFTSSSALRIPLDTEQFRVLASLRPLRSILHKSNSVSLPRETNHC